MDVAVVEVSCWAGGGVELANEEVDEGAVFRCNRARRSFSARSASRVLAEEGFLCVSLSVYVVLSHGFAGEVIAIKAFWCIMVSPSTYLGQATSVYCRWIRSIDAEMFRCSDGVLD